MKRSAPIRRGRKKRRTEHEKQLALDWIRAVIASAPRDVDHRRVCAVTLRPPVAGNPLEGHHVVEQQKLRRMAGSLGKTEAELVWDVRAGLPVLRRRHEQHTNRSRPIPFACLTPANRAYLRELGLEEWAREHYA